MAKRKGPSTSRPRARNKAAKEGTEARTSEGGGVVDECDQLRSEVRALGGERAKLSGKELELEEEKRRLEEQKRTLEEQERELQVQRRRVEELQRYAGEQLQPVRLEVQQVQRSLLQKESRLKDMCSTREAENAKLLDKLPLDVWEKIVDENDLFPLALSCRYFRQKQKELVARMGQNGKHRCALRTNIRRQYIQRQQASADYLRFCYKEIVLSEFFPQRAKWIMKLAAYHGDLTLLQEHEKKFELDAEVFYSACAGGNLETLKWLRSKGCPWSGWACSSAAKHGHLEILKWLRSEGCPWDEGTFTAAVERGHLQMLKWLRSKGCPWDGWACEYAATRGKLDLLRWAIDNGCPYWVNKRTRPALEFLGLI